MATTKSAEWGFDLDALTSSIKVPDIPTLTGESGWSWESYMSMLNDISDQAAKAGEPIEKQIADYGPTGTKTYLDELGQRNTPLSLIDARSAIVDAQNTAEQSLHSAWDAYNKQFHEESVETAEQKPGQSPGDDRSKEPYDKDWPPPAPLKKPVELASLALSELGYGEKEQQDDAQTIKNANQTWGIVNQREQEQAAGATIAKQFTDNVADSLSKYDWYEAVKSFPGDRKQDVKEGIHTAGSWLYDRASDFSDLLSDYHLSGSGPLQTGNELLLSALTGKTTKSTFTTKQLQDFAENRSRELSHVAPGGVNEFNPYSIPVYSSDDVPTISDASTYVDQTSGEVKVQTDETRGQFPDHTVGAGAGDDGTWVYPDSIMKRGKNQAFITVPTNLNEEVTFNVHDINQTNFGGGPDALKNEFPNRGIEGIARAASWYGDNVSIPILQRLGFDTKRWSERPQTGGVNVGALSHRSGSLPMSQWTPKMIEQFGPQIQAQRDANLQKWSGDFGNAIKAGGFTSPITKAQGVAGTKAQTTRKPVATPRKAPTNTTWTSPLSLNTKKTGSLFGLNL